MSAVLAEPRADRALRLERVRAAVRKVEASTGVAVAPIGERWLPVPEALAPLLPRGIRHGSVVEVAGSTGLLVHLVAALAGEQAWCAVVARPDLGLAAALAAGIDPARLVLVPDPGPSAGAVLGALVDGFDIVVVGECEAISPRERRSLTQRVRHRGAVLISSAPWPASAVRLAADGHSSTGFEQLGRLESVGIVVEGYSRGDDRRRRTAVRLSRAGLSSAPLPRGVSGGFAQLSGSEREVG